MAISYVAGRRFKRALIAGVNRLTYKKAYLDRLNVFPVPDGDTGTNMSLTLQAALNEIENLQDVSLRAVANALTWGSLMGARGNSGVILAQIFAGFAEGIGEKQRITSKDIASALKFASQKAYEAVVNPVEGTILTVVRETAQKAMEIAEKETDIVRLLEEMVAQAKTSLENTPRLLPVLKEAGVVDSGSLGFVYFLEGMLKLIKGEALEDADSGESTDYSGVALFSIQYEGNNRYCTEFVLKGENLPQREIREALIKMGDSLLVTGDSSILRIHIHTSDPEKLLQYVTSFGTLSQVKVDDMLEQHRSLFNASHYPVAVIAVVLGEGFRKIFTSLGADVVIEGGQTMNPTVREIFRAIEEVPSSKVIVLPNNGNVFSAALQATKLSAKEVGVIPSRSIPEGIVALMAFNRGNTFESNLKTMEENLQHVESGEIVYASRSSVYKNMQIEVGDILGICNDDIKIVGKSLFEVVIGLIEKMVDENSEIITLFYGRDVCVKDVEKLTYMLERRFPSFEIEIHPGGQPHYLYILSVE